MRLKQESQEFSTINTARFQARQNITAKKTRKKTMLARFIAQDIITGSHLKFNFELQQLSSQVEFTYL